MKKIALVLLVALAPTFALADTSITLDVEAPSGTLYKGILTVAPCPVTLDAATTSVSAKCALEQASLNPQWSNYGGDDWFLTAAGGAAQDFENNLYWGWWSDLSYGQVALNQHEVVPGESLLVALGVLPLRIVAPGTVAVGATTTITVEAFGFDSGFNGVWSPSASTTVAFGGLTYETTSAGTIDLFATSTDPFTLTASRNNFVSATLALTPVETVVDTPVAPPEPSLPPAQQGGGSGGIVHQSVNVSAALAYLSSVQQDDGSFGAMLLSDWAALAFAAADPDDAKGKLYDYMLTAVPTFSSVTDYERHALALLALGINPYSGTPTDVISPIVRSFDGVQIGDASLDTDDIFALFPLLHAGFRESDDLIQKTSAFIVSRQRSDGSWDGNVDVTAAAVQALAEVRALSGVSDALARAERYLHTQQAADGGFGNSFSTSWALQAISVLREQSSSFAPTGYTPQEYLAGLQQTDGGLEPMSASLQTRIWATAYVVPALLGKTWSSLLVSFALATSTSAQVADTSTSPQPLPPIEPPVVARTVIQVLPAKQEAKRVTGVYEVTLAEVLSASSRTVAVGKQTAAAADAPVRAFFSTLWRSIASFFSRVL